MTANQASFLTHGACKWRRVTESAEAFRWRWVSDNLLLPHCARFSSTYGTPRMETVKDTRANGAPQFDDYITGPKGFLKRLLVGCKLVSCKRYPDAGVLPATCPETRVQEISQ
jgi:hypothetical protein